MSFFKRLLSKNRTLFLSTLLVLSLVFARPIIAASPPIMTPTIWSLPSLGRFIKDSISEKLSAESTTFHLINSVILYGIGAFGGCDNEIDVDCPKEFQTGGLNAVLADITINTSLNPPASSKEYLADVGQSIGIVPKPVYAQGIGWSGFSNILPVWKAFRNLAYLAMVVIFVIIGFMIMFRKKLNPQTVITIQEAIPRLIVTMLLITFSYAIAGFLLDISQVLIRLIGGFFQATGLVAIMRGTTNPLDKIYNANVFQLMNPLRQTSRLVKAILYSISNPAFQISGAITLNILRLFLFFSTFYMMIKTAFALVGPYVQITLSVVFAPIQLLLGAIPGNSNALSKWIKGLFANAMVFPVVLSMLFLAAIFKSGPAACFGDPPNVLCKGIFDSVDWSTKRDRFEVSYPSPGIGNWGGAVGELIGLGILFMIPKAAEMTKAFIMGKEFPGGEAAMQGIYQNLGKIPGFGKILSS